MSYQLLLNREEQQEWRRLSHQGAAQVEAEHRHLVAKWQQASGSLRNLRCDRLRRFEKTVGYKLDELNLKRRQLQALNRVNQDLLADLQPRLGGLLRYHSQNQFWSHLLSGIYLLRTRIYAYKSNVQLQCPNLAAHIAVGSSAELAALQRQLEDQQVQIGTAETDLREEKEKIDSALRAAVELGKRFRIDKANGEPADLADAEWERAEELIERFELFRLPAVSLRTCDSLERVCVDDTD